MTEEARAGYWLPAMTRRVRVLCEELEMLRDREPELFAELMRTPEVAKLRRLLGPPLEYDL